MIWPALALALAWTALRATLAAQPSLDADSLYIPELWQRLRAGGSLGSWYLTPNPSLWPDLPAWHATQWLVDGVLPGLRVYGMVSGLALCWLAARLLRALDPQSRWQSLGWVALGLALGLAAWPQGSFLTWMAPAHQGTPFLAALWLWALVLEHEHRPPGPLAWFILVLLLGLFLASSKALWYLGLVPALFLSLRSRSRLWLWGALPLAGAFVWLQGLALEVAGAHVPSFRWSHFFQRFGQHGQGFLDALPSLIGSDARFLGLLSALGLGLWARLAWHERGRWAWLFMAWVLASVLGLAMCFAMGSASGRFLYLVFWLPALWLPYLAARLWPEWSRPVLLLSFLAVLLWRAHGLPAWSQPLPWVQAQWLKDRAQAQGWYEGWADYWRARPLRVLAGPTVSVLPMVPLGSGETESLRPYFVIVDSRIFPPFNPLPRPDFVVMNGLPAGLVQKHWGPPRTRVQGPGLELWVYAKEKR